MSEKERKGIDGKAFIEKLDACITEKDEKGIFNLLHETMSDDILKDRVKHMSDNDLVIALKSQAARFNTLGGCRTSHEDCVIMAAGAFQTVHEGNKNEKVKCFKISLAKDSVERQAQQDAAALVWRHRQLVH